MICLLGNQRVHRGTRRKGADKWFALALLAGLLTAGATLALAEDSPAHPIRTLADIGIDLEVAWQLPPAQQMSAVEAVQRAMQAYEDEGVPSDQRFAAALLWGEIYYTLGDLARADEQFGQGIKKSDDEAQAAAARFGQIQVLAAERRDEDTAEEWRKWLEKYPTSPLVPEAELNLVWNQLRRSSLSEAGKSLDQLETKFPWLNSDPRVVLARASHHYFAGRFDAALGLLDKENGTAAAIYLRALCHDAKNDILKAAAAYQEVATRFPDSALRDHALLAKANTFLASGAYKSAAEEFERVGGLVADQAVKAEADLRGAACVFLAGDGEAAVPMLREVVLQYEGTEVAARAQFLLGEVMLAAELYEVAILEFNRVLTSYFDQSVAASAQYRVGRCFDALDRRVDATSAYQAVVSGYPLEPEAPAAAYLAGAGLLALDKPRAAVPYFQLVLDRYTRTEDGDGTIVFASPEHQELVEASLCLLELAYHRTGDLGQLAGAPHLLLHKTPPSRSSWRAYALLIDADALAAQGQYAEARKSLESLFQQFPEHESSAAATQLLAWTYAQQGEIELAIRTSEQMLARYGQEGNPKNLSSAYLNLAHVRFNQKKYTSAAEAYEEFLYRFPDHKQSLLALYQAGLCYLRLDRGGDAVDRWETIVARDPAAEIAERAWARAGDLYFQADQYEDAKRCYQGLLQNFAGSSAAALGMLRIAQCDYNAGDDAQALSGYAAVTEAYPASPYAREAERGMELALYRLGQKAGGVDQLAELVQQHPTSAFAADAQFQIATRYYENEQYWEAAEEFRRVVSQFPGYSAADRAQFLMADSYAKNGDRVEARQAFDQFLLFFAESELRTTVQFRLGMIYFEDAEYLRAAINFTGVLEAETTPEIAAASQFNLALCKRLLGHYEEAVTEFEKYRAFHPGDERTADVAYQLGDIHDLSGRTQQAIEELERALTAEPAEVLVAELNYRLGACFEKIEQADQALAAYQRAAACKPGDDPYRLSAVARTAVLFEEKEDYRQALTAYRDLIKNAHDPEIVAAATGRASELAEVVE